MQNEHKKTSQSNGFTLATKCKTHLSFAPGDRMYYNLQDTTRRTKDTKIDHYTCSPLALSFAS